MVKVRRKNCTKMSQMLETDPFKSLARYTFLKTSITNESPTDSFHRHTSEAHQNRHDGSPMTAVRVLRAHILRFLSFSELRQRTWWVKSLMSEG